MLLVGRWKHMAGPWVGGLLSGSCPEPPRRDTEKHPRGQQTSCPLQPVQSRAGGGGKAGNVGQAVGPFCPTATMPRD